ncbi:MAG: hypothetical protein JNM78_12630 [Cyclobacteriaceae bacterium]|nr:hypothetical protein [Cyclobacteriaceae bacterium]
MKNSETLTLIDGLFNSAEAKELLATMISSKINFHNIKNWSSQERFGKNDEIAQKRIPELKKDMEKLQAILSEARANNKKLLVSSKINIILMDE